MGPDVVDEGPTAVGISGPWAATSGGVASATRVPGLGMGKGGRVRVR